MTILVNNYPRKCLTYFDPIKSFIHHNRIFGSFTEPPRRKQQTSTRVPLLRHDMNTIGT